MLICVNGDFAGSTAEAYRRFRRDVPPAVLDQLMIHFGLGGADRAVDLGAGTGQVAVGLAARLAGCSRWTRSRRCSSSCAGGPRPSS